MRAMAHPQQQPQQQQQLTDPIAIIPERGTTTTSSPPGFVSKFAVVARLKVGPIGGARSAVERLVAHLDTAAFHCGGLAAVRLYLGLVPFATTDEQAAEALRAELAARYTHSEHGPHKPGQLRVHLETLRPSAGIGTVADVWQALGSTAFKQGADYVVLLHTARAAFTDPAWARHLLDEMTGLARALAASLGEADVAPALEGFGCVALLSDDRPRDRFDLVLPRAHYETLGRRVLPAAWVADAASGGPSVDRRLYYTYAKLNAARPATRCGLLHGKLGMDEGLAAKEVTAPPTARLVVPDEDATVRALAAQLAARLGRPKNGDRWNGGALALLRRRGLPPSLDVVVPTYRVDMGLLEGIGGTAPANQGTLTYVVVDDPDKVTQDNFRGGGGGRPTPLLTVAIMQRRLSRPAKPALVLVNNQNMGVTKSRNRGIAASGAEWIVLQDDDVVPDAALLKAYSEAIARHAAEEDAGARPVVGICGMIHFPEPYNLFTAALRMSGVTNAFEIAQLTPTPVWGCTANVCMRNGPWLHFADDWEKCGGGEDIDFFLRLQHEGRIRSAYAAAVTHPWWTNGKRSYWHFHMWGLGDGRLQKLYPEHCYRSAPCAVETLAFVLAALALVVGPAAWLGLLGPDMTPRDVLTLAALIVLGVVEVDMLGNVFADRLLLRPVNSGSLSPWRRALGAMEAALILDFAELSRLQYHLCHRNGRLADIGVRFDFYCGTIPSARRAWKATYALKFPGFVVYGIVVQVWLATGHLHGPWAWMTPLLHAGCVAFLASLVCGVL